LAQRLERIRKRERLEQLAKFHQLTNLFRRRRAQKWRFTNEYIKFWSQEFIKKWHQLFKDIRPLPNWRQAIAVTNPYHPANAHTGIGADVNRTASVIGTPMPDKKAEGENQKVLVLQGNPTCGTKILFFDKDGTPQKSAARQQTLFTPSQFECNDIQSLAAGIKALENQPDKFIIHGQPSSPLTGEKINRRKYQGSAKTPPSIKTGATLHYFPADIDNLSLANLGYDENITDVSIESLVEKITEKYLTDFQGVSYYAQFSSTAGWTDKRTVKMHIWWWLDKETDLVTLKKFAKRINELTGLQILDTSIYQETQPIYIAAPIFAPGHTEHLSERSKLVILPKASASLSSPTKRTAKQEPQTFEAWRQFFSKLGKNTPLHENLTKFFFWAIKAQIPEDDFVHIKVALEDSPRMKKEPERWLELQNGEWENLFNWCKQQAGQSAKEEKPEETAMPLPPGYVLRKSGLFLETVDSKGKPSRQLIYAGFFRVVGFYADADTGFSYIEIQMETNEEIKNVIVPQDQVSTRSAIVKTLAKLGGRITEENAKACVKFITASMNPGYIEKLQHTKYTRRLGFHGNSFVLPGRTLGEKSNLEYKGVLNDVRIEDQEIYTNTVRTIFNEWGEDAWVAGAALGFSLASPFVGHLRLNRNPILVLTGESGSGKSTLLNE
jgi:hypothetical protein